jgi:hypothetical protein
MTITPQLDAARQLKDETFASGAMRAAVLFPRLVMATLLAGLSGCSSNYEIRTTDGKTYSSQGAPQFTDGGYTFTDADGQRHQLYLSQVSQVRQR